MASITVYSDLDPRGTESTRGPLGLNHNAVFTALDNLFATARDERLFNPDVTADLEDILFELEQEDTEDLVYEKVFSAIEQFEPRVEINVADSQIKVTLDGRRVEVRLRVQLRGLTEEFEYRRYFEREV